MKENVRVVFKVKKSDNGDFSICLDPLEENLKVLGKGVLGFELPEGTTANTAEEIAAFLQENIRSVFYVSS
jgi:hypothetical protein